MLIVHVSCRRFSLSLARRSRADWKRSKDRKFIDWRRVSVCGGTGGDGCVNFRREAHVRFGGPDGGNGGCGGGVVLVADPSVRTLANVRSRYHGEHGGRGQGALRTGKNGKDVIVRVPLGTVIKEEGSDSVIADLTGAGEGCVVVRGGEGGLGNAMFASADHRRPVQCTEGEEGERRMVEVELKTIADVGMVGLPNAGKSTLLQALSRATPRVAAYPFTTLNPHIGVMEGEGGEQIAVADIPGLLPGAHRNKGLGHSFLRHIERCKTLLYVLDASIGDPDPSCQLDILQSELNCYDPTLSQNASLVVANKMDTEGSEDRVHLLQRCTSLPIVPVSALHSWNIGPLKEALSKLYVGQTPQSAVQ